MMIYGTAWKEERTAELATLAFASGFRAIDTANQRKHYYEEGVGKAIARKIADGSLRRDELFLQTKFTFVDGQDERLPYDRDAPIREQVAQSFRSSLEHLGVDTLDSLVLHGPSQRDGLGTDDRAAWRAMEAIAEQGQVKLLGISNVTAQQVTDLVKHAQIAPAFVQNRCHADRRWDGEVRKVCSNHGIIYQGFSLLTANKHAVASKPIAELATRHDKTPAQIIFRFAQQIGILPLTGTRDAAHMKQDLAVERFELNGQELAIVDGIGVRKA